MTLQIYSTLSRSLETFVGRDPGRATIYSCGPTVYDVPHVGHARMAVVFDVLARHLRTSGLEVTFVRNVTDVDDKILARAGEVGVPPLELAHQMEAVFRSQMQAIGCLDPDHEPRVSEHLPQVIELVQRLVETGAAYLLEMPDGTRDVYFSVRSFPEYGKLSRRRLDELKVGARVAKDEHKRDPLDFALWKGATLDQWGWDSPWGRGRPGWHIECSAMSTHYLGYGFDIHGGGMDLIFPHHENEIAQSEAARPGAGPCVRYWMHNGFVNVSKPGSPEEAEKMSKSLGNMITLGDVLERNDPEAIRWFLLTVHYRGPVQFEVAPKGDDRVVFPGIDEAEGRVDYMYSALRRLRDLAERELTVPSRLPAELLKLRDAAKKTAEEARAALDDDLNTAGALAALGELGRLGNELADQVEKRRKDVSFVAAASVAAATLSMEIARVARELGLLIAPAEDHFERTRTRRLGLRGLTVQGVQDKIDARTHARQEKRFAEADALRAELVTLGIAMRDTPVGTEWTVNP